MKSLEAYRKESSTLHDILGFNIIVFIKASPHTFLRCVSRKKVILVFFRSSSNINQA